MRPSLAAACLLSAFALAASAAHAEMAIGGYASQIAFFGAGAQGTDAPLAQITGPDTQMVEPAFGVYEPNEQLLYVSDFNGRALLVYPAFARGNVAPLRVLNPPQFGQTRASAPVYAHDEIGIIVSNCCIATYPLHASGSDTFAIRTINWGGLAGSATDLNNPLSLRYLPASDEYVVSEYDRLVFHARTAGAYDAPTRRITGPAVANCISVAHDPAAHRLFVLCQAPWDGSSATTRVRIGVFADDASGEAAPLYTIEGDATGLDLPPGYYVTGIGHDPYVHRLMVASSSNSGNPAQNRVVVFADGANGNATPVQQLSGATLSSGWLGTPFAVPLDAIFANGFDG
ncbi:hypothetical protein [Dokdonella sp.]|uniref:hypothetical protein n=1 Tax=Dokdonella sp. TaxID=2291710 RepID=UPI00262A6055|nr:hypothetical protein [Dokdonella sp.]